MVKLSIKTAILIPSISVLVAGITVMAIIVGILSTNSSGNLTNQLIEARIDEHMNGFEELCGGIYSAVAAVTPIVEQYTDPPKSNNPRGEVIDILSKVLMSNEKIIAIWTCWEPDAFDGKDIDYAEKDFYDKSGRFVPYLYKNGTSFNLEALVDYEEPVAGEYYQGAKNSAKPYITDPYYYLVGDIEVSITSLAFPIIKDDKTLGVVGVDIDLREFVSLMNSADILEDGFMSAISPSGLFASHKIEELQMQSYKTTWLNSESDLVDGVLKNGGHFSIQGNSDVTGNEIKLLGFSLSIGDTGRNWLICGAIPIDTINKSSASLLTTIIIIGIILVFVVGFTIFKIVNMRLKNLSKLTASAEAIQRGDIQLDELDSGSDETRNEITLLERAFFNMGTDINKQAEIMSKISEGDYTVTVPIRSEKDIMNIAMNEMLDTTNHTLNQINSSADQVFSGSRQIADSAQSLASGASEQAASMQELSASINDITAKTEKNAAIAKEAAILSNIIIKKAENGNIQMEQMMAAVNEISGASQQIGNVIKAIDEIAFQTNILSLNAAVEAASAGQYGKGFAVVAEEVRNLAAKSAKSAKDTGKLIENSKLKASQGLIIAEETSKSLKEIIDSISHSAGIVSQIEKATNEQANAISQINTGIEQVSNVIQQNSAASEESAAASEQMSGQSEMLSELISKFKLKE